MSDSKSCNRIRNRRMQIIAHNIVEIDKWIDDAQPPTELESNDDFMRFSVEVMRRCLYLLRLGSSLVPYRKKVQQGYAKHGAIIVGHMVRIVKLYEGAAIHISQRQCELALVFFRLIWETAVRLTYLISSQDKRRSCQSFIIASYKPEREALRDLRVKEAKRSLLPIERRIRRD